VRNRIDVGCHVQVGGFGKTTPPTVAERASSVAVETAHVGVGVCWVCVESIGVGEATAGEGGFGAGPVLESHPRAKRTAENPTSNESVFIPHTIPACTL
jgi:hypothetical protein